ncbi:hypothetical protein K1T71_000767 [Dendrolimus kikuchii]|uniref:Uncharacterized protein n=1 Tax=Dendrolimus kikuchii TaxID=765133 RepID=A0ACC1DKM5_9NEOP|nr:hypothetical protein K1T71_000767 [Dendrolimus kikuchii]
MVLIDLNIFMSLGYKTKFENLKQLFISLIKIVNKSGPSRDPWDTPEGIFTHLEEYPLTTTACDLLSIQEENHLNKFPCTPAFSHFCKIPQCISTTIKTPQKLFFYVSKG